MLKVTCFGALLRLHHSSHEMFKTLCRNPSKTLITSCFRSSTSLNITANSGKRHSFNI